MAQNTAPAQTTPISGPSNVASSSTAPARWTPAPAPSRRRSSKNEPQSARSAQRNTDPPCAQRASAVDPKPGLLLRDGRRLRVLRRGRDLDLPRLRLGPLGQEHPQHAVLRLGRDVLHIHGARQRERPAERAVGALDAVIPVALVLVLQLALALEGERVALDLDLDVLRLDFRQLRLQGDAFGILEDVDQRRPGRHHRLLLLTAGAAVGGTEGAEELVLQREQVAERVITTNDGHTSAPFFDKSILPEAGGYSLVPHGDRNVRRQRVASRPRRSVG